MAESRDDEAGQILDEIEQGFDRWPPNSRIFVHDIRARLARANGRPADAFHHYRRALKEDAEPHGLPAAAILHLELGFLSVQLRDFDTAQKEFSQALALGRRLGMPRVDAMVRVGQGWLEFDRSEYAAATTYFERAHAEYERLGDREGIAHTLAARAKIEERLEDYDKSVAYALRANAMARGLGAKLITALIAEILAGEAVRSGDYLTGAHLMGARLALREACRVVWPADAQVQACDDTIRRRLGNEAEGAYAAGRKLSTEQTVSLGASLGPDR